MLQDEQRLATTLSPRGLGSHEEASAAECSPHPVLTIEPSLSDPFCRYVQDLPEWLRSGDSALSTDALAHLAGQNAHLDNHQSRPKLEETSLDCEDSRSFAQAQQQEQAAQLFERVLQRLAQTRRDKGDTASTEIIQELINSKVAAAQFAFERDEARSMLKLSRPATIGDCGIDISVLVSAKLAAAQYAFERDEARQQKSQLCRVYAAMP